MSSPNAPQTAQPRVTVTFADWGATYKIALGVIGVGVSIVVFAPFVGGVLMQAASPLLEGLAGAPPDRLLFAANDSQAGIDFLVLLGVSNLIVGICLFAVRLVLELLGLAGEPMLTRRIRPRGKLVLGAAAAAMLVLIASASLETVIGESSVDIDADMSGMLRALDITGQIGALLMASSIITLFWWGRLFRWADAIGWGRPRWGWINRLSVAMIAAALLAGIPGIPFDDAAYAFGVAGATILILGVIPQIFARRRP